MAKVFPDSIIGTSFRLYSSSVRCTREGGYSFDQVPILMSTESLRRLLKRTVRAVKNFDIVSRPWQGVYLHMWLTEFLIPLIHIDENMKKNIMAAHYTSLGESVPLDRLHYNIDEEFLLPLLEDVIELSYFLCTCSLTSIDYCTTVMEPKLRESQENLIVLLDHLHDSLDSHYKREEEYWPRIFRKYGPKEVVKMLAAKIGYTRRMGDVGHAYIATVLFSLGHLTGQPIDDELDVPWCGPRMSREIVKSYPFLIKYMPPNILFQPFLKFRNIIEAFRRENHNEDVLCLVPHFQQLMASGQVATVESCFNRPKKYAILFKIVPLYWRLSIQSLFSTESSDKYVYQSNSSKMDNNYQLPWMLRASSKLTQASSSRSLLQF